MTAPDPRLLLIGVGGACVAWGVHLIYHPAGVITVGLLLVALAWLLGDITDQ